ncbi:MAG: GNAT family N-acetyltransferase [Devosia sp.]|nr:GNAT family N-acetyltransferase [Devosia sp.]
MTTIRPARPDEFGKVVALARQTLAMPAISEALIARDFLLAPGYRAEHLLVAEASGTLAGFALVPRADALGPPHSGWIAAFGVDPGYRRRGIGTQLLGRAIDDMRRDSVTRIDVADVPVRYLLPGVDRAAFPGAYALLEKLGFTVREEVASMGIALDRDFPDAAEVRPATPGELPLVREFFAEGWDNGWWGHFERSALLKLLGDPTPSEILGWWEDDRVLGLSHYRGNRFGPLAVGPKARGRGLGVALTQATLAAMRRAGLADAYFLVGREDVQPFYARLGFSVLRRFTKLALQL